MGINPQGLYCAYLRKSRADLEEEARGQGETLARHERILRDTAQRLGIRIAGTYREIVSGDTIAERPEIRRLLSDINAGQWDGVLVVDVDRLGRGDSIDQGIILQSFVYTGTLIVTPDKVYNPQDDADAEFFEIKLFFSRREYSMIKKRMQRGRLSSAADGCYMGSRPVYGYERVKLKGRKGWSLAIVPEKADIVRQIFAWYADGLDGEPAGCGRIARRLDEMGLKTDLGNAFTRATVKDILQNPAYIGKVQWNQRVTTYRIEDGVRKKRRVRSDEAMLIDGLHEPIIERALWDRVQAMFRARDKSHATFDQPMRNSLAGLVICGECGHTLYRKVGTDWRGISLACPTIGCPTCATRLEVVEDAVLDVLASWVRDFEADSPEARAARESESAMLDAAIRQHEEQRAKLQSQLGALYDLLEQGVYSVELYRQRHTELTARVAEADRALAALRRSVRPDARAALIPRVKTVLAAYRSAADGAEKNTLLRSVVSKVVYHKLQRCYRNNKPGDYLTVEVFPRVPDEEEFL
ncbi:MAG: recombinase family protein [Oscillospiraceae bacterium]|nr:recombinase family protein [Oscillospiraceae bacterium]